MSDDDHVPERDRDSESGLAGMIRHVLGALVDAERTGRDEVHEVGHRPGRRFSIEYGFSGRIGGPSAGSDAPGLPSQSRTSTGSYPDTDEDYLVDVREADDAVLVVADLPDVDVDDLTVGLADERSTLVIGVDDEPVERFELPWPVADVDPRLHHGVLEIRIVPEEGSE